MKRFENPIYVTKCFLPPLDEYINMIKPIWESNWVTNNGPLHEALEEKICRYLNVKNGTLFVNGHLALDNAIKLFGIEGEVITTPFTFASTTHAIVMNKIRPVFCDINLKDFTIDVDKIEGLITEKTSAIIPVHVFGYPCDVNRIEEIAKKYDIKVIYDAAHAFGVEINGRGIGEFGDISMFSLHATKVFNSIEGGVLTYNDSFKSKLNVLKNFGITGMESVQAVGMNAKMNEFQAAMGLINLDYIDKQIQNRNKITNVYRSQFKKVKGIYYLDDIENVRHNYSYFPIVIDRELTGISRDVLHEELKKFNIFTRKYFYPLITDFDCYKGLYDDTNLNNARYIADNILTLPIYGDLGVEEAFEIAEIVKSYVT